MKQRRIKKLVKQVLNVENKPGDAKFATKAEKKAEEARLKTLSDADLLVHLLDPDLDAIATDVAAQKEAAKAGVADAVIDAAAGNTEAELGTEALITDTDGGGEDDRSEVDGGRDPLNDADDI